eukprot:355908-Chlamydomonas_euryale.AAC.16
MPMSNTASARRARVTSSGDCGGRGMMRTMARAYPKRHKQTVQGEKESSLKTRPEQSSCREAPTNTASTSIPRATNPHVACGYVVTTTPEVLSACPRMRVATRSCAHLKEGVLGHGCADTRSHTPAPVPNM